VGFFPAVIQSPNFVAAVSLTLSFSFFFFFVQSFLVGTKIKRKWGEIRDKHRRV
jgi:hypothetical protein